ncbi:MAG: right-handed parallel beta-helix repeat-containing protein [Phycisphaerales bacterium]|nr:right-handed parallel beta-helix repeat-containing protein [Phycisphaerales bacterium]
MDDDGKADFNTIQAAVDAASSGDEIQIMPGSYQETLRIPAITLRLSGMIDKGEVVLNGDDAIRLLEAVDLQGEMLRLENLTFTNAGSDGASIDENNAYALYVNNGDCFLYGCRFLDTNVSQGASQVATVEFGSHFVAAECVFSGNTTNASNSHTGLVVSHMSTAVVTGCRFEDNNAGNTQGRSPLLILGCPGAVLRNSVFRNNACFDDGAAATIRASKLTPESDDATVENCLFENNRDAYSCVVGALNIHGLFSDIDVEVVDCMFRSNPRSAISVKGPDASVRVSDSIFCQNSSNFTGCQGGSDSQILDVGGNCFSGTCDCVIHVPQDHSTIQEAIDAAPEGGRILVDPGEYPEAIDFGSKNLVLESIVGPEQTIVGRYGTKISIVTIGGDQSMDTELRGFTIQRGYRGTPVPGNPSSLVGGGVFVNEASPLIENCIFTDNKTAFGSGVYHFFGGGEVRDCQFVDNYATSDGGGALTFRSDVEYVNCIFDDNFAIGEGGGIKVVLGTTSLTSCMFVQNESRGDGGAVFWFANDDSDPMEIVGCTITANLVASDARGAGVYARPGYAPVRITDSAICGNEPDEIYGPFVDVSGNLLCICPGDLNGDGEVGGADLGVMLALWGECLSDPCDPDLNGDGFIDGGDLGLLLGYWGFCPQP